MRHVTTFFALTICIATFFGCSNDAPPKVTVEKTNPAKVTLTKTNRWNTKLIIPKGVTELVASDDRWTMAYIKDDQIIAVRPKGYHPFCFNEKGEQITIISDLTPYRITLHQDADASKLTMSKKHHVVAAYCTKPKKAGWHIWELDYAIYEDLWSQSNQDTQIGVKHAGFIEASEKSILDFDIIGMHAYVLEPGEKVIKCYFVLRGIKRFEESDFKTDWPIESFNIERFTLDTGKGFTLNAYGNGGEQTWWYEKGEVKTTGFQKAKTKITE